MTTLAALALHPASAAFASEDGERPSQDTCLNEEDEDGIACFPPPPAPAPAPGPPACLAELSPDGGLPAAPAFAQTTIEGARVRLFPARIRPGDFFAIDVVSSDLLSAAGSFSGQAIPLFARGRGLFRGFFAVPLDFPAGPVLVHVAVVGTDMKALSASLPLQIVERQVIKKSITVDKKFTSPSEKQTAQMKADARALVAAYRVEFGPPHFSSDFVDPLGHERGSRFGERRVFNGKTRSRHYGLDIDGDAGEPVRAANDGVVVLVRPCFMSGNTVIVSHGAGLFTAYLHFSKFAAKVGAAVKKGEVLGYVGMTGRATGPHLHFAARLHSVIIDPEALLSFDFSLGEPSPPAPDAGSPQDAPDAAPAAPDECVQESR